MKNDVILNFTNRLVTALIKIVLYGIIARSIGVEEFGFFIILVSVLTVISQFLIYGSEYSIVSLKYDMNYKTLLLYTFLKGFIVLVGSYILLLIFIESFNALAIGIYICSQILTFMCGAIYLKFNKYLAYTILNFCVNLVTVILITILEFSDAYFPLLIMGGVKITFLLGYSLKYILQADLRNLKDLTKIYNNSLKFVVFEQLKFIHHRIDVIILSANGLTLFSGYLAAIKNFVEATQYIPKTVQMMLYKYSNKTTMIFKQSYRLISLLFIMIFIFTYYFGSFVIKVIFGEEFTEIHAGLMLSLIGAYFYSLAHLNMSSIVVKSEKSNILNLIISFIYFSNYFILINLFNYYGAIIAFILSSIIYFTITLYIGRQKSLLTSA